MPQPWASAPFAGTQRMTPRCSRRGSRSTDPPIRSRTTKGWILRTSRRSSFRFCAVAASMSATARGSQPVVVVNQRIRAAVLAGQESDPPAGQVGFVHVRQPVVHGGGPCRRYSLSRTDQREGEHLRTRPTRNSGQSRLPDGSRTSPASLAAAIRRAVSRTRNLAPPLRASSHWRICSPRRSRVRGSRPRSSRASRHLPCCCRSSAQYGRCRSTSGNAGARSASRMALGAAPSNVRSIVLRRGLTMGALGVVLGGLPLWPLAVSSSRFSTGVSAADPLVLAGTARRCSSPVLAATVLPTRLATRTDPLLVLRGD